jgi:hypothetical protein
MSSMHPMERLRHVARSGGADPAVIVAETVDALTSLCPAPSELVPLCRNLVERNPTCGPLWWLCAQLLAKPEDLHAAWTWAEQVERDGTPARLAERLPDESAVMTVGYSAITARALRSCGNVSVLAVMAGGEGSRLVRAMDRAGVDVEPVVPESMLATMRRADLVVLEADACSTDLVVASIGSALGAVAAAAADVPVWLVAGRGRRLPVSFVEAIGRGMDADHETFSTTYVSTVVGPEGVVPMSSDALAAECPATPELLPN